MYDTVKFGLTSALLLSLTITHPVAAQSLVAWSSDQHQPHFGDVNADGINDVLLQAKTADHDSLLVFGGRDDEGHERFLTTAQQPVTLALAQTKMALADLNGDGHADLWLIYPNSQVAQTYWGSAHGFSTTMAHQYDVNALSWLSDADDFQLTVGDFNGDGRQDMLALSAQDDDHALMHADEQGRLQPVQRLDDKIKWGKNGAERFLVNDYNADGRDDIFAWAQAKDKHHYLIYANDKGLFSPKLSQKIKAKINGDDWHGQGYSVAAGLADGDNFADLVRFNNGVGGIDENGEVVTDGLGDVNKIAAITAADATAPTGHPSFTPSNGQITTTQSLVGVPPTPTRYPGTFGNSYKPINVTYTMIAHPSTGASYYEMYESPNDSNYQKITLRDNVYADVSKSVGGYQYYRYKACNSAGCSAMSAWRRIYVHTKPGPPLSKAISPLNVNPNEAYVVSWAPSYYAVHNTEYRLFEQKAGSSERQVYAIKRQHWSERNYSFTTAQATGGVYHYRIQACSPVVGCGDSVSITQTVTVPNTPPLANNDSASINEDSAVNLYPLNNDSDPQGSSISVYSHSNPSHGSLSINGNTFYYSPHPHFVGHDAFSYTIKDAQGLLSNSATVTITVHNINDQPTGSVNISGDATINQRLSSAVSVQDADGLGALNYQWYRGNTAIAGATDTSYVIGQADIGQTLKVTVRYTDGQGTPEAMSSATVGPVVADSTPLRQQHYSHTDLLGSPAVDSNTQGSAQQ